MRNLEGYPVQWEAFLVLRSLTAMSSNEVPDDLIEWYSTDEYRATLPTYLAAVVSQITKSYVLGITISELIWWWVGAVAVFVLARTFVPTPTAYCAGIFTCASPLGVGHIGSAHLHTASSLSLSVFIALSWQILHNNRSGLPSKTFLYGACIYLSSITYTYQWFLAPFFVIISATPKFSRQQVSASIFGIGFFLILRIVSYGILSLGGLEVHLHQNDPVRVIASRTSNEILFEGTLAAMIWNTGLEKATAVFFGTLSSYHVFIFVSAIVGLIVTRDSRLALASGAAIALACAFGAIYDIAWVLMTGYPFVYTLAAHGMASVCRAVTARIPHLGDDSRAPVTILAVATSVAAALTNLDLIGDATFAINWWRWWYTPH